MRASELINRLEEIIERDGDVEVELPDGTLLTRVTMVAAPLPSVPRRLTAAEIERHNQLLRVREAKPRMIHRDSLGNYIHEYREVRIVSMEATGNINWAFGDGGDVPDLGEDAARYGYELREDGKWWNPKDDTDGDTVKTDQQMSEYVEDACQSDLEAMAEREA